MPYQMDRVIEDVVLPSDHILDPRKCLIERLKHGDEKLEYLWKGVPLARQFD